MSSALPSTSSASCASSAVAPSWHVLQLPRLGVGSGCRSRCIGQLRCAESRREVQSGRPVLLVLAAGGTGGLASLRRTRRGGRRGRQRGLARRSLSPTAPGVTDLQIPTSTINEAGFDVGVTMTPEQAEALGIKPFGDGGADDSPSPRLKVYTHGPCASPIASQFVVQCRSWRNTSAGDPERGEMLEKALSVLRSQGFVVLENLLPTEYVEPLEAEAAEYLDVKHEGLMMQPLRANRKQLHLPFTMPWASDWLVKHELILEMVAKYVQNNLAGGRNQEEQQMSLVNWLMSGAELDWFRSAEVSFCAEQDKAQPKPGRLWDFPAKGCSTVGSPDKQGPWLGRVMVTKTPPGSPSQKHHRDINFPGPTAQLTIQVALTPLVANNGPLGYVPGSHRMSTPGYEVVANPPLGSVVLYDSFCEHHGIENHTSQDRYAMYYEFETRGIFGGYTDDHFGPQAAAHTYAFRHAVDPDLRRWVDQA